MHLACYPGQRWRLQLPRIRKIHGIFLTAEGARDLREKQQNYCYFCLEKYSAGLHVVCCLGKKLN